MEFETDPEPLSEQEGALRLAKIEEAPEGEHYILIVGQNRYGTEYCRECKDAENKLAKVNTPRRLISLPVGQIGLDETADFYGGRQGMLAQADAALYNALKSGLEEAKILGNGRDLPVPCLIIVCADGTLHHFGYVGQEDRMQIALDCLNA